MIASDDSNPVCSMQRLNRQKKFSHYGMKGQTKVPSASSGRALRQAQGIPFDKPATRPIRRLIREHLAARSHLGALLHLLQSVALFQFRFGNFQAHLIS
jgi:hypothetical protein